MKVLLVLSQNASLINRSGEVEVKILQLGFKLNGHQCDVLDLNSDDFDSYDIYIVFSLYEDVEGLLRLLPKNKVLFLYPQTEKYTKTSKDKVSRYLSYVDNSYLISRSNIEDDFYSGFVDVGSIYSVQGWFLEPFISDIGKYLDFKLGDRYILSFSDKLDMENYEEIISDCIESDYILVIVSSNIKEVRKLNNKVRLLPKQKYGSSAWYHLLDRCAFFYESNNRITNSVLEATYLGKKIVSKQYHAINELFGYEISGRTISDVQNMSSTQSNSSLYKYRVEVVANNIISFVNES